MIWPFGRRRTLVLNDAHIADLIGEQPWLGRLNPADRRRLLALMAEFLTDKTVTGAGGLQVDDWMRLSIAAQACLPVLNLGLSQYDPFREIVLHPCAFTVKRIRVDEIGLVTEVEDSLAGESIDGGPVVLSWSDIRPGLETPGKPHANVVIHEFAHKLDLSDGVADGCPRLLGHHAGPWRKALLEAFEGFCQLLDAVESSLPGHIDPDSEEADPWYGQLPLDPYAALDPAEFFAVACEAFFTDFEGFYKTFPELYACFVAYFKQDPAAWRPL